MPLLGEPKLLPMLSIELMESETNYDIKASATHEDIVMSSVLALLKGLNLILKHKNVENS